MRITNILFFAAFSLFTLTGIAQRVIDYSWFKDQMLISDNPQVACIDAQKKEKMLQIYCDKYRTQAICNMLAKVSKDTQIKCPQANQEDSENDFF